MARGEKSGIRSSAVQAATGVLLLAFAAAASAVPKPSAGGPPSQAEVRQAEQRLAQLGYWTGPVDGVWDEASRQGLVAFQKVQGMKPTGRLTRADLAALARAVPPAAREVGTPHVEVDLFRQVLFLVDAEGKVANVLPISSGSGKAFKAKGWGAGTADTPCGHFEVFARAAGWKTSPLGEMYNPLYIVGGIAIHGSLSVPPRPASHGCIRVPMFASYRLPQMVPKGTPVLVYGCRDELGPRPEARAAAAGGPAASQAALPPR
jgi:peptidoglycan hydrolase-like protein with peptidoglycan-binding domain